MRRAKFFRESRLPKFLDWFESVLVRNPKANGHLVRSAVTYADLSPFQGVESLSYVFPRAVKRTMADAPHVAALHRAVSKAAVLVGRRFG